MFVLIDNLKQGGEAGARDAGGAKEDGAGTAEVFQLLVHFMVSCWSFHRVLPPRYDLI